MKEYIYKFKLLQANIFSLVILAIFGVITFLINPELFKDFGTGLFLLLVLLYFMLHEVLHGIGYILGGAHPKNIYFGIALEKGILYCLCREEIKKKAILTSLQMPFTVIGLITYVIGLLTNNSMLTILSICNLTGASMDLVMFFYIMRIKGVRYSETDKNDEFVLITKENLSKKKSLFFDLVKTKEYDKKDFVFPKKKRIEISKQSIWLMLLVIALAIVSILISKL